MKRKNTVAIIEDDILFGDDLKELFQNSGFEVINFNSFNNIDAALKIHKPNLIVCDLTFPDGRADNFINQLREDRFFNLTPIVVLTGADLENIQIDDLLCTGISALFFKPTPFESFLRAVNKLLIKQKEYAISEYFIKMLRYPFRIFNLSAN